MDFSKIEKEVTFAGKHLFLIDGFLTECHGLDIGRVHEEGTVSVTHYTTYMVENSFMVAHPEGGWLFVDGRTHCFNRMRLYENSPNADKAAKIMEEIGVPVIPLEEGMKRWDENI